MTQFTEECLSVSSETQPLIRRANLINVNDFPQFSDPYDGELVLPKRENSSSVVGYRAKILEKSSKVYVSGPITGVRDFLKIFEEVDRNLTASGYYVVNPAKVNAGLPISTSWEDYMKLSFCMLDMCDTIYQVSP